MTEQIRGETGYYEIPGNRERHSSCKLSTIISKCLIEQVINMGKQLPGFHHVLLLMNISCKNWPNQFHWSYILMHELGISKAIKHPKNTFCIIFYHWKEIITPAENGSWYLCYNAKSNLYASLKFISWWWKNEKDEVTFVWTKEFCTVIPSIAVSYIPVSWN